jgi:hypothetical protein
MRIAYLASLATTAALLAVPAHAVCFAHDPSLPGGINADRSVAPRSFPLAEEFDASFIVATVNVVSARALIGGEGVVTAHDYRLTPRDTLKGPTTDEFTVRSENTSARFSMDPGKTYLVFLRARDGASFIDACGWSDELSAANETLSKVRDFAAVTRQPSSP